MSEIESEIREALDDCYVTSALIDAAGEHAAEADGSDARRAEALAAQASARIESLIGRLGSMMEIVKKSAKQAA